MTSMGLFRYFPPSPPIRKPFFPVRPRFFPAEGAVLPFDLFRPARRHFFRGLHCFHASPFTFPSSGCRCGAISAAQSLPKWPGSTFAGPPPPPSTIRSLGNSRSLSGHGIRHCLLRRTVFASWPSQLCFPIIESPVTRNAKVFRVALKPMDSIITGTHSPASCSRSRPKPAGIEPQTGISTTAARRAG